MIIIEKVDSVKDSNFSDFYQDHKYDSMDYHKANLVIIYDKENATVLKNRMSSMRYTFPISLLEGFINIWISQDIKINLKEK